jgi:hypothetical protein
MVAKATSMYVCKLPIFNLHKALLTIVFSILFQPQACYHTMKCEYVFFFRRMHIGIAGHKGRGLFSCSDLGIILKFDLMCSLKGK